MKKSFILSVASITLISSCAGPESYEQKMARYTPKVTGSNLVPQITSEGFNFKNKVSNNRLPASAEDNKKSDSLNTPQMSEKNAEESTLSNKKLYFLTLLGQYETMKKFAYNFEAASVSICPQFHTSLLEHNEKKGITNNLKATTKFSYDVKKLNDTIYVNKRPELFLPLAKEETTPRVLDIIRSNRDNMNDAKMDELVHKALDIHLAKTYSEIRELCEFGVSNNYYIYENLITHIKSNEFKAKESNMDTLLKTTIFSNIALVTSLEKGTEAKAMGRAIASITEATSKSSGTPYAKEVMVRLNVEWAKEYFEDLKSNR